MCASSSEEFDDVIGNSQGDAFCKFRWKMLHEGEIFATRDVTSFNVAFVDVTS